MRDTVLSNISSVSFITDKQREISRSKLQCSNSLTSTEAALEIRNKKRALSEMWNIVYQE